MYEELAIVLWSFIWLQEVVNFDVYEGKWLEYPAWFDCSPKIFMTLICDLFHFFNLDFCPFSPFECGFCHAQKSVFVKLDVRSGKSLPKIHKGPVFKV